MGLLDNVLTKQKREKKSTAPSENISNDASARFYDAEKELKRDLSYFFPVLNLARTFFDVEKLVVISYDRKADSWLPVSSCGMDVTSARRIRFSGKQFTALFPKPYSRIEDSEQLSLFRELLSIREFSMLTRVEAFTLDNSSVKPKTALLLLNNRNTKDFHNEFLFIIQEIDTILKNNKSSHETSFSLSLFVSRFLSKAKADRVYLIKLDYEKICTFIQESLTEEFDETQLVQDIFDTIYSMVSLSGRLLKIDTYSSLLLYATDSIHNPQLLIAQISSSIKTYYNIQTDLPPISSMVLTYPEDGEDTDTLLRRMNIL